eukprot:997799-Amphidinium_carterae.1
MSTPMRTCAVPFPEPNALHTIYSTFMKGHFERLPFKNAVQERAGERAAPSASRPRAVQSTANHKPRTVNKTSYSRETKNDNQYH